MNVLTVLTIISGIIILGFSSEILFKKSNIPDVIILIVAGIILRASGIVSRDLGFGAKLFTVFALIFLLFQGALNISIKSLASSFKRMILLTVLTFLLSAAVVSAVSFWILGSWGSALLAGVILGGTSSAVVIPLVKNLRMKDSGVVLTLESAVSDVLCIVGAVTIIGIMSSGIIDPSAVFRSLLSSFAMAFMIGALTGLLWLFFLDSKPFLKDAYMVTIAIVLLVYVFVESPLVRASGAIASLTFGLVLGNAPIIKRLFSKKASVVINKSAGAFYEEVSFFVKTFFFVYLGSLISFDKPTIFFWGFLLSIVMFLVRPLAVKILFHKINERNRILLEVMIPKGLAAAVLAGLAVQNGVADEGFSNLILSVIFISILLTSFFVFLAEKKRFYGLYDKRTYKLK